MAKVTIKTADEYCVKLSKLEARQKEIAGKAIYAGAKMVADQMSANLEAIPEDAFRYLRNGDVLTSASKSQKKGLMDCFGVTSMEIDDEGDFNVKCGFSEYIDTDIIPPTKNYPRGLPAAMLVRSIESGSSVRQKHPFVRPAVAKTKNAAKEKMGEIIEEEIKKTMGG